VQHVEHVHADPHFRETIEGALRGRTFDIVVASYGRTRHLAAALAGRCGRFLAVGGIPLYRGVLEPETGFPHGLRLLAGEEAQPVEEAGTSPASRFAYAIHSTEREVMALGRGGAFAATYIRYPLIYGPRCPRPREWSIVRRVLDGRERIALPNHGLAITTRAAALNAAHTLLLAVDRPDAAAGEAFNCADDQQFSLRQWVQLVSRAAGRELDIVDLPSAVAWSADDLVDRTEGDSHRLISNAKAKRELGYADVIGVEAAVEEAVDWCVRHRSELGDAVDYALEDELVARHARWIDEVTTTRLRRGDTRPHSYPHPRHPDVGRDHRGR
jgi:nucleoside-diphosphate-sugar epimerase